ncbi:MAG: DUF1579 domain-containing protein [Planctomycetes bacterium]|nr:DUF1579 domain-containing protein [Planctomycetota bacterium]
MKVRLDVLGLAIVLSFSFLANVALPQDDKSGKDKYAAKDEQMDPERQAIMDAWAKYATPGSYHDHLKPMVGTWATTSKYWMKPGDDAEVGQGTAVKKMILDGRYLAEDYSGMSSFGPFTGVGLTGYDNSSKKYVGTWVDSMGTAILVSYGTCDSSGKTITFLSEFEDPIDGKTKKHRSVIKIINNDKHVLEMFVTEPGQKEHKELEVIYTRKS